jgi:hypothetical protein
LSYKHPSISGADFANCDNFIECNKSLVQMKCKPINWNVHKGYSHLTFDEEINFTDDTLVMFLKYQVVASENFVCYTSFISKGPLNGINIQGKKRINGDAKDIVLKSCFDYIKQKNETKISRVVLMTDDEKFNIPEDNPYFDKLDVYYYGIKNTVYTEKENYNVYCAQMYEYVNDTLDFNIREMALDTEQIE